MATDTALSSPNVLIHQCDGVSYCPCACVCTYRPMCAQIFLKYTANCRVYCIADYKHRGPGFDSRALLRIFLRELSLERGPLSLVIG
jgi:hypothetical protein